MHGSFTHLTTVSSARFSLMFTPLRLFRWRPLVETLGTAVEKLGNTDSVTVYSRIGVFRSATDPGIDSDKPKQYINDSGDLDDCPDVTIKINQELERAIRIWQSQSQNSLMSGKLHADSYTHLNVLTWRGSRSTQ
ncbi:hypothetical protein ABVK25_009896 [Lepraria finkii]|uniref:Uncharacterized protein n=1 Tax=Lepraria finkii TaxID=1340010 RepID=A0ABR4AYM7_9LECA